jgi:signal transduction histidine kinase
VSHDLRSPLAIVKLHLETVLKRDLSPEQSRSCLDAAWQELGRLEAGIEGVLMASRLEREKLQVDARPLVLREFLERYIARKREAVERGRGHLESGPLPSLVIRADPVLFERILDNLVDNALAHCPPGVNIRVSATEQSRFAVVTVEDDGPGIERRERSKIFDMFYRAPHNLGQGTGLGLFIVAGLAKAHGGQAWVESPGIGSAFRVALPLAEEDPSVGDEERGHVSRSSRGVGDAEVARQADDRISERSGATGRSPTRIGLAEEGAPRP